MEFRKFFIFIITLTASFTGKAVNSDNSVSQWLAPISSLAKISQSFKTQSVTPLLLIVNSNQTSYISGFDELSSVEEVLSSSKTTDLNMKSTQILAVLGFNNNAESQVLLPSTDLPLIILIELKSEQCANCKNRINSLTQLKDKYSTMSYQISPLVASISKVDTSALNTK